MLEPRFQRLKRHTDTDLVTLTYCYFDVEHGSLGTQGGEHDSVLSETQKTVS